VSDKHPEGVGMMTCPQGGAEVEGAIPLLSGLSYLVFTTSSGVTSPAAPIADTDPAAATTQHTDRQVRHTEPPPPEALSLFLSRGGRPVFGFSQGEY